MIAAVYTKGHIAVTAFTERIVGRTRPPCFVSMTGSPNMRFSSSISSQARRYDMPIVRPAAKIEP